MLGTLTFGVKRTFLFFDAVIGLSFDRGLLILGHFRFLDFLLAMIEFSFDQLARRSAQLLGDLDVEHFVCVGGADVRET